MGVSMSWPTGSLKRTNWLRLRLMDQSQEILLDHAIFASSRRIARSISNKKYLHSTVGLPTDSEMTGQLGYGAVTPSLIQ